MKYRFKWDDHQILRVMGRIKGDMALLNHAEMFHQELSENEMLLLKWTPETDETEITDLIKSICLDSYISTLRSFIRSREFNSNIGTSKTIRLSSHALTTARIISKFPECNDLTKSEIIDKALTLYWNHLIIEEAKSKM